MVIQDVMKNGGPCTVITTSHFTKSAMPQNKFRILSAHLTSCVAGDIKLPGKLSKFWFPQPTKNFCLILVTLCLLLERIHSWMLEYFCSSPRGKWFTSAPAVKQTSYTGLECTGEVMVRGIRGGWMTDKELFRPWSQVSFYGGLAYGEWVISSSPSEHVYNKGIFCTAQQALASKNLIISFIHYQQMAVSLKRCFLLPLKPSTVLRVNLT